MNKIVSAQLRLMMHVLLALVTGCIAFFMWWLPKCTELDHNVIGIILFFSFIGHMVAFLGIISRGEDCDTSTYKT